MRLPTTRKNMCTFYTLYSPCLERLAYAVAFSNRKLWCQSNLQEKNWSTARWILFPLILTYRKRRACGFSNKKLIYKLRNSVIVTKSKERWSLNQSEKLEKMELNLREVVAARSTEEARTELGQGRHLNIGFTSSIWAQSKKSGRETWGTRTGH